MPDLLFYRRTTGITRVYCQLNLERIEMRMTIGAPSVLLMLMLYVGICYAEQPETLTLEVGGLNGENPAIQMVYSHNVNKAKCDTITDSTDDECKYYGECCGDPVRIRERLEPGTFECMNIGNVQGGFIASPFMTHNSYSI